MIIAAGLLAAIFIPFQKATAFTVNINLPTSFSQSVAGESFVITVAVDSAELISIANVTLILDDGLSGETAATFSSAGNYISGNNALVIDNQLQVSPFTSSPGHAYGFGLVTNGATAPALGLIGGNDQGAGGGSTNEVTGLLGPGSITISGTLRTAALAAGSHTLDVRIDTGGGGNDVDQLAAPPFSFSVSANDDVVAVSVSVPANTPVDITIPSTGAQVSISFGNGGSGQVVVEKKTLSEINTQNPTAFTSFGSSTSTFTAGGSSAVTVGEVFEIDVSAASTGSVTVTIPYNPALVPSGQSPTLFRWTGTAWEQATNVSFTSNTITGTFTGLSPVVAGAFVPPPSTPSGGGAGRTVTIPWPPVNIFPASHFALFPLDRVQVRSSTFLNAQGFSIAEARVNQQISISGEFANYQQTAQDYAFIVQVINPEGFATDIRWQESVLGPGQSTQVSTSVTLQKEGVYTVKIFVWDGVSDAPKPLSEVTVKNLRVTE